MMLFTQLVSDTGLTRNGFYEFLLAVVDQLIIISVDDCGAPIMPTCGWKNIEASTIVELANEAAMFIAATQQPLRWSDFHRASR